jgi:hypothetical protein
MSNMPNWLVPEDVKYYAIFVIEALEMNFIIYFVVSYWRISELSTCQIILLAVLTVAKELRPSKLEILYYSFLIYKFSFYGQHSIAKDNSQIWTRFWILNNIPLLKNCRPVSCTFRIKTYILNARKKTKGR